MNRSFLIFISLIWAIQLLGQNTKNAKLKYISPEPNSKFIMPGNNVAFRHGEKFDPHCVKKQLLKITNSRNEEIDGQLKLSSDGRTLIFKPNRPYCWGDVIQVYLQTGLRTESGTRIEPTVFHFEVSKVDVQNPEQYVLYESQNQHLFPALHSSTPAIRKIERKENNLPEGFPGIQVNFLNENASDGYYFFTPYDEWGWYPDTKPFLTITDIYGTPIYYRKMQNFGYDLKIQPTGNLSFYSYHPFWRNMIMDSAYQIIDNYKMGNGYGYTDFHEFQLLENGHAFVMTYDPQFYAMDTVVPGGHPNAIVIGFVFQELDSSKEVVFQWRSWDHFLITDAASFVDLTDSIIDYVHGNTIDIESDSSLLISCKKMEEITRIDRNTGDIIWRFGGENNQFEYINDTLGFSVQHDCRRLDNGNITLFDNGSKHPDPKFSSGLEYEMDEINMIATLVHRLRNMPDNLGVVMGNKQWRSDSSKVIGWGSNVPGISEFDVNGEVVYEMEFEGISYRAYLFPWKTNYFLLETDTLQYGTVWHQDTMTKELYILNNVNHNIGITSYYSMNEAFTVENEFPVTISPGDSVPLMVKFDPGEVGMYEGVLTINSDINSDTLVQRIAQQVYIIGKATEGQGYDDLLDDTKVMMYPNPVDKELVIEFATKNFKGTIQLYNIYGNSVIERVFENCRKIELDIEDLPSGVYFVYLNKSNNTGNQCYKILKN